MFKGGITVITVGASPEEKKISMLSFDRKVKRGTKS